MDGTTTQPALFESLRRLRISPSVSQKLNELVDLAIGSITNGQTTEAVGILNQLKRSVATIKPQLDRYPEMLVDNVIQMKLLQKENCELGLALARFQEDEESICVFEEMLKTFDEFCTAAIEDLDPDRA